MGYTVIKMKLLQTSTYWNVEKDKIHLYKSIN